MLFFFKQKTAYEMRISDWSSDVCSSDLREQCRVEFRAAGKALRGERPRRDTDVAYALQRHRLRAVGEHADDFGDESAFRDRVHQRLQVAAAPGGEDGDAVWPGLGVGGWGLGRTISRFGHDRHRWPLPISRSGGPTGGAGAGRDRE